MKNFLVLVEAEDYINVDAENEDEAIEKAIEEASRSSVEWSATILRHGEPQE